MKQKVELVIINIIKVYFDFYRLFISEMRQMNWKRNFLRIELRWQMMKTEFTRL